MGRARYPGSNASATSVLTMSEPLDLDRLRHEIDAEVRARRASGDYPPGFERELDAIFARYAPPAASDDIEVLIDEAEEAAGIELAIPTESDKRGGAIVPGIAGPTG